MSRLWIGPLHIEALLAAGRLDEARERLAVYAKMVGECQTAHFDREVVRLEAMVAKA